ncbi:WD40-repeat-containing domain protein [Lactifluus volemus]|nr:WD40-repeat-containing domain protein [Lactifluus volemus]
MSSAYLRRPFVPTRSSESAGQHKARQNTMSSYFASGFPYSRKLTGHSSCVNALAFSSGEGRWLASAGDGEYPLSRNMSQMCKTCTMAAKDRVVKLWDLHQEDVTTPSCSFKGPSSNVFTVAFSASNQYVYSGGADNKVLKYELSRYAGNRLDGNGPLQAYTQYQDFIRSVSCHPYQDEVFMSASEDGCIMLHDGRAESRMTPAQGTLQQAAEFSGAFFHPRMEHLFVTSDIRGNVRLRDTRMAFGPLRQRTKDGIVLKYVTRITKRSAAHYIRPEASSITWDPDGTKLGVAFLHWLPTIYALSDPYPIAVCSGRNLPDGTPSPPDTRTFSDATTMKHGSFGGSALTTGGEAYYSSGSDDFRGYLWRIPSLVTLKNERQIIDPDEWLNGGEDGTVAFTGSSYSSEKYVPKELSTPLTRLNGHLSIVNSTLIHPVLPLIATAGIERHVFLHSPTSNSPWASSLPLTPTTTRQLPSREPIAADQSSPLLSTRSSASMEVDESMGEDAISIAYFDRVLQHEDQRDLFSIRRQALPSDDDADDGNDIDKDSADDSEREQEEDSEEP